MATVKLSPKYSLQLPDVVRGALLAAGTTLLVFIQDWLSKEAEFDWKLALKVALRSRSDAFDHARLNILLTQEIPEGLLVIYDCSYVVPGQQMLRLGAALIDPVSNYVKWRSAQPIALRAKKSVSDRLGSMQA